VIVATGASYKRLGIDSVDALLGTGVVYGAATAEAPAQAGRHFFVERDHPGARRKRESWCAIPRG
jgi:thioredoxin reductase